MKRYYIAMVCTGAIFALFLLGSATHASGTEGPTEKELRQGYWDDRLVIVQTRPGGGDADPGPDFVAAPWATAIVSASAAKALSSFRIFRVKEGVDAERAADRLRATDQYLSVERNYLRRLIPATPTPMRAVTTAPVQWALKDISAAEAWQIQPDAAGVVVAVIDGGIREVHPDLQSNLAWIDQGGLSPPGWKTHVSPGVVHGTLVAGVLAGAGVQGGTFGVCPKVKLLPITFTYDKTIYSSALDVTNCILYAVQHEARVINCSFGGEQRSSLELAALETARAADVVVVIAAGNESRQIDQGSNALYPASYAVGNIVVVAASTKLGALRANSNWGRSVVGLAAPGETVLSTDFTGDYSTDSDTSIAAPHVAGAVALLRAKFPGKHYNEIIRRLYDNVDPLPAGDASKVKSGGRLNIFKALSAP